jgi:hypothetical protein
VDTKILDKIEAAAKRAMVGRWYCDDDDIEGDVYRYLYARAENGKPLQRFEDPVCQCSPGRTGHYIAEVFPARIWQMCRELRRLQAKTEMIGGKK